MNFFMYEINIPDRICLYVSVVKSTILVTTDFDVNVYRKEDINDFSWGACLQNILLFGMTIFRESNFKISHVEFKNSLKLILQRISQFEKLGHITLAKSVMILFLNELYCLINKWIQYISTLQTVSVDEKKYLVENSIGLLVTFHILFEIVNYNI